VERHGIGARFVQVLLDAAKTALERIRLRRQGEVYGRLGEREIALREADQMRGLLGGRRDHQRLRIGQADVLARQDHDAPGDEHRVLAGVDHPHQPIQRGVWV